MFTSSTWAPFDPVTPLRRNRGSLPRIGFLIGAEDPLTGPGDQIAVIRRLQKLLPQLDSESYLLPSFHVPGSSVEYKDNEGTPMKFRTMKLLAPVLDHRLLLMLHGEGAIDLAKAGDGGTRIYGHPAFFKHPKACADGVSAASFANTVLPWPPPK